MLILDDLIKIILEGITDYINRAYYTTLKNKRHILLLLHEQGKISEEEFRKQDSQFMAAIIQLEKELKNKPSNTTTVGL
jgi:hypothetical protein